MCVSHLKLKVLERSTGNKKVEEWKFLPKDWQYHIGNTLGGRPIIFEKNFVILKFHTWGNLSTDIGDILILNLVTRTKFWMRCGALMTKVKEKAAGRIDLENLSILIESLALKMIVEKDRIVVKYYMRFDGYILG